MTDEQETVKDEADKPWEPTDTQTPEPVSPEDAQKPWVPETEGDTGTDAEAPQAPENGDNGDESDEDADDADKKGGDAE